jgi:Na+/melibiose symporter-like transporter
MPLLASTVTRDPLALAVVSTAAWLPWLLVGLLTGALVDRWDRRTVMWRVDAVRAAVVAVLVALIVSGRVSIPLLAALAFVLGVGQTLYENATQAIVPAVVGRDPARLARANSQLGAAQTGGKELAGPPLGGVLFTVAPWAPFLLDAMSFGVGAALIAAIRGRFAPARRAEAPTRLRAEIAEGLRWVWRSRVIRTLAVMAGVVNAVYGAGLAVMVLYAQDVLGLDALGYGLLLAAVAVGVLPGSLIAPWLARTVPTAPLLVGGIAAVAVLQAAFGLAPVVWVAVAAEVLAGVVYIVFDVAQISLRQELVPRPADRPGPERGPAGRVRRHPGRHPPGRAGRPRPGAAGALHPRRARAGGPGRGVGAGADDHGRRGGAGDGLR